MTRDRALGRGVHTLIPQQSTETAAVRAAAALAALQTASIPVGVLQAALVLLEDLADSTTADETRDAARATADRIRAALEPPTPG